MPIITEEVIEQVDYSDDEIIYRDKIIKKMTTIRDNRDTSHIEFDDMDYITYYETNAKAGNSYIRPKKNSQDTRIVTGTTLEKENTILSSLLNFNFKAEVQAYDQLDILQATLGSHMSDLIKKSKDIEDYERIRPLIYKEGLDQGTGFVEEVYVEEWRVKKEMKKMDMSEGVKIKGFKWGEELEKIYEGCRANLIPGTKVYLFNIREFMIERQPGAVIVDTITYSEAKAIYGKWERFANVPKKVVKNEILDTSGVAYRDWSLLETNDDMVEVIKYYDKFNNEAMIMLNGVMMLPIEFPLTAISPSGEIPIAKLDIEPISKFFAYSKSFPAKTKVDQELLDDTIRTLVLRMRQLMQPPMANNTNRVLSDKIFYPGKITPNIPVDKLKKILGENNMISSAEFQVFEMIKKIVDSKTASPVLAGEVLQGRRTAKEMIQMKQQAMMKIGLIIFGVLSFERRLAWLRLWNIVANWTKPIDTKIDEITGEIKNVYKNVTVETSDQYGAVTKNIEFNPEATANMGQEQLNAEADILSTPERPVQKVYMNPELIRSVKMNWFIEINPTDKESTELERVLFEESVMKAKQIYGPTSTNDEYGKQRYAILMKEDPNQFWSKQPQVDQAQMQQMAQMQDLQQGGQGGTASKMPMAKQMQPNKMQQPSLNTMVNG